MCFSVSQTHKNEYFEAQLKHNDLNCSLKNHF